MMATGVGSMDEPEGHERAVVRRSPSSLQLHGDDESSSPRTIRDEGLIVSSELRLGVEPRLFLSWAIPPSYRAKGFSLQVFHSLTGFCPEKNPEDLNRHGQLIIATKENGSRDLHLFEGDHYYTFVLHKRGLFFTRTGMVRIHESVPTARIAIGRVRDKIELEELLQRYQLGKIDFETNLIDAALRRKEARRRFKKSKHDRSSRNDSGRERPLLDAEIRSIDEMLDVLATKREKIESLKRDAKFQSLSEEEQQSVLRRIEERLDAAELSARREERGD